MLQPRLARLTAVGIKEAFAEDERVGVVQPCIVGPRHVIRVPEVSRILQGTAGLIEFPDEVRLWFPLTPRAQVTCARAAVLFDPLATELHELALVFKVAVVPHLFAT